jgi:L-rhamnose isomerase/sugar isomerase
MLDQCHNIEPKVPAIIRSVQTLQELFAKALLVDRDALVAAQARGDILAANNLLWSAFFTDVRGPLAELRQERGLPAEPFAEYLASGEDEQRSAERIGGDAASW